jgi:K+-sensing histidine kinase KdpD
LADTFDAAQPVKLGGSSTQLEISAETSVPAEEGQLLIETEDECGGVPQSKGDLFQVCGDRRGSDRSGLGLGLSIARKAVRAHGGEMRIGNMPGKGCVFIIEVPLATEESLPEAVVWPHREQFPADGGLWARPGRLAR